MKPVNFAVINICTSTQGSVLSLPLPLWQPPATFPSAFLQDPPPQSPVPAPPWGLYQSVNPVCGLSRVNASPPLPGSLLSSSPSYDPCVIIEFPCTTLNTLAFPSFLLTGRIQTLVNLMCLLTPHLFPKSWLWLLWKHTLLQTGLVWNRWLQTSNRLSLAPGSPVILSLVVLPFCSFGLF